MGRYTSARSFDDRSAEVQAAPTEQEKEEASKKDVLEVSNVMGSTAGAGSGDFHQYRQSRRKEMFSELNFSILKRENEEFERKKRERAEEVEKKHQKRVEKRKKKKMKKMNKGANAGATQNPSAGNQDADEDDSGEDEEEEKKTSFIGPSVPHAPVPHEVFVNGSVEAENVKVKEVQNVRIVDVDVRDALIAFIL
ncbi:hypothetical protein GUITHDRAFT_109047 [Guillardia theta CCMP2712]|uniref:Uncharacterized protein n=1 Tax=Guillardia theta (strain CCMP2712) TaxID=905079 RepID=L1J8X1_GUITC|nr:hypothetical protein GUITHDRAFT_109047 [Guillardia theta CCMP2712]EKX45003.1 hypothetical protein GUITHDRAFT_109047 [Guillardia theta CCMP2712]|eukprot:XP_005831983.1 hypothetical protein GUITHDRAFT_109047 [Guillardia theta CCMP2712]